MTGACEESLSPGLAAYQQLTDAGRFCDLAEFDDNIATICRGATGEARNQALAAADKRMLCTVFCCCARNPVTSSQGRSGYDTCATQTLTAAESAMGNDSRFKPQTSFNMRTSPPTPLMERRSSLFGGGLTTERIPNTRAGNAHMANRVSGTGDGSPFVAGSGDIRRPDVVIVRDPESPPIAGNITRVVDFKFTETIIDQRVLDDYATIGNSIAPLILDHSSCDCSDDETQGQTALATAAQAIKENDRSMVSRIAWGAVGTIGALATAAAALFPLDGPAGEIALGVGTAAAWTRALGAAGMTAARARQTMQVAGARWNHLFGSGARLATP